MSLPIVPISTVAELEVEHNGVALATPSSTQLSNTHFSHGQQQHQQQPDQQQRQQQQQQRLKRQRRSEREDQQSQAAQRAARRMQQVREMHEQGRSVSVNDARSTRSRAGHNHQTLFRRSRGQSSHEDDINVLLGRPTAYDVGGWSNLLHASVYTHDSRYWARRQYNLRGRELQQPHLSQPRVAYLPGPHPTYQRYSQFRPRGHVHGWQHSPLQYHHGHQHHYMWQHGYYHYHRWLQQRPQEQAVQRATERVSHSREAELSAIRSRGIATEPPSTEGLQHTHVFIAVPSEAFVSVPSTVLTGPTGLFLSHAPDVASLQQARERSQTPRVLQSERISDRTSQHNMSPQAQYNLRGGDERSLTRRDPSQAVLQENDFVEAQTQSLREYSRAWLHIPVSHTAFPAAPAHETAVGFTRSAADNVVCVACNVSLWSTVWFLRQCGHVYCQECASSGDTPHNTAHNTTYDATHDARRFGCSAKHCRTTSVGVYREIFF